MAVTKITSSLGKPPQSGGNQHITDSLSHPGVPLVKSGGVSVPKNGPPAPQKSGTDAPGATSQFRMAGGPPMPPEPVQVTWFPGIDVNRTPAGSEPGISLASISPFIRQRLGIHDTEINPGDIFPNIQEAFGAMRDAQGNLAGQTQLAITPEQKQKLASKAIGKQAAESAAHGYIPGAMLQMAGHVLSHPFQAPQGMMEYAAGRPLTRYGGLAAQGLQAGTETVMRAFPIPGNIVQGFVGSAAQGAGISPSLAVRVMTNPMGVIGQIAPALRDIAADATGRPTSRQMEHTLRTAVASVIDGVANNSSGDVAEFLHGQAAKIKSRAPSDLFTTSQQTAELPQIVATVIAHAEARGVEAKPLEHVLEVLEPDHKEELLAQARQFVANAKDPTADFWYSAQFSYSSSESVLDAAARIRAGENVQDVVQNVSEQQKASEIIAQVATQAVLDPLQLFDAGLTIGTKGIGFVDEAGDTGKAVGLAEAILPGAKGTDIGTPLFGGGQARRVREWTHAPAAEFLMETPLGNGMKTVEKVGDITAAKWYERIPVAGKFISRTEGAKVGRIVEEFGALLGNIVARIDPQASVKLAEAGFDAPPEIVALTILMDPTSENVLGSGIDAYKARELLGMGVVEATADERRLWGLPEGARLDQFNSNAADRARWLFDQMTGQKSEQVVEHYREALKTYNAVLRDGTLETVKNGKAVTVKGQEALDVVTDQLARVLDTIDEVTRESTGVKENLLTRFTKPYNSFQVAIGRYFQMGPTLGYPIRNYLSDGSIMMMEGIDRLSPLRRVAEEVERLGIVSPGFAQGGRSTAEAGKKGLDALLPGLKLARHGERDGALRGMLHFFNKNFTADWQVGRMIDRDAFYELEGVLGRGSPLANSFKIALENARTEEEYAALYSKIVGLPQWKLLDDGALAGALRDADLLADVDTMLAGAKTKEQLIAAVRAYIDDSESFVREVGARTPPPPGSISEDILRAVNIAVGDVSEEVADGDFNDFWRNTRGKFDVEYQLLRSRASKALSIVKDNAVARALERDLNKITSSRDEAGLAIRAQQEHIWGLIYEAKSASPTRASEIYKELEGIDPLFRGVKTNAQARFAMYQWTDNAWRSAEAPILPELHRIFNEANAASGNLFAEVDPAVIDRYIPVTKPEQRSMFAGLVQAAANNGFVKDPNDWSGAFAHLRNFLRKTGQLGADEPLGAQIITTPERYNELLDLILEHGKDLAKRAGKTKSAPQKLSATEEELWEAVAHSLRQPAPRASVTHPADLLGGEAARHVEREALLQQVINHVMAKGDDFERVTAEQGAAIRAFLDNMKPHFLNTRAVAKSVAALGRNFIQHNYGDRRNFDMALGLIFNYPYWYSRNYANFARRAMTSPGAVANVMRFMKGVRQVNSGKPDPWRDDIPLEIMGHEFYLPIQAAINPLYSLFGDKFRDPDLYATPYGSILAEAQQYGPGLHIVPSLLMMIDAFGRGRPDEATSWMSYLGQPTRAVNAMSVLARALGADFIPPTGIVLEPWLWEVKNGNLAAFQGGSKWDRHRIGMALADLAADPNSGFTQEQLYDAMRYQEGPSWDAANDKARLFPALYTIGSWLLGSGFKVHPEMEMRVYEMDQWVRGAVARKDELTPEQYRQLWSEGYRTYPELPYVFGMRRNTTERYETYAWGVLDRLPPNSKEYFMTLGMTEEEYQDLIVRFYQDKGMDKMTPEQQQEFMRVIDQMGAVLSMPDNATAAEWNQAQQLWRAMKMALDRQFPEGKAMEATFYQIRDEEGPEAAYAWLEVNGGLEEYWRVKNQYVTRSPLLSRYYATMDTFDHYLDAKFEDQMEQLHPGIHLVLKQYYNLRERDPEAAKQFIKDHPELPQYWDASTQHTLELRDQYEALLGPLEAMGPKLAGIRTDAKIATTGQQSVADLIASGRRPMGDFELPEDLDARELQAAIKMELASIPDGRWGYVFRELRDTGDLDRTLTAFQQWGDTSGTIENVTKNQIELQALLAALGQIRELAGWNLIGHSDVFSRDPQKYQQLTQRGSSGSARGTTHRRTYAGRGGPVRSHTWGGSSSRPHTQRQRGQEDSAMNEWVSQLMEANAGYWNLLRQMAGMTHAEIEALLAANPRFASWMSTSVLNEFNLKRLLEFIRQRYSPESSRAPAQKKTSGVGYGSTTRLSNPLL